MMLFGTLCTIQNIGYTTKLVTLFNDPFKGLDTLIL
jgi:hypothetical protein